MTLKELCKESPFVLDSKAAFYIAANTEVTTEMMKTPGFFNIIDENEINAVRNQTWAKKLQEAYKEIQELKGQIANLELSIGNMS